MIKTILFVLCSTLGLACSGADDGRTVSRNLPTPPAADLTQASVQTEVVGSQTSATGVVKSHSAHAHPINASTHP